MLSHCSDRYVFCGPPIVPRTKGRTDCGPIAPNSNSWVTLGTYTFCANMATTCGMPHPTNIVLPSSMRRAPWAIMNSVSVNSIVRDICQLPPPLPVALHYCGAAAQFLHPLRPDPPVEELLVIGDGVDVLLDIFPHLFFRADGVQPVDVLEIDLVSCRHRAGICPEGGMDHSVDQ